MYVGHNCNEDFGKTQDVENCNHESKQAIKDGKRPSLIKSCINHKKKTSSLTPNKPSTYSWCTFRRMLIQTGIRRPESHPL